jgi:LmbE family N-acetylglucosaminyl deacetylase
MREQMEAAGVEMPVPDQRQVDPEIAKAMEEMEKQVTTTVDATRWAARKQAALTAHASQLDEWGLLRLPTDVFANVFGTEAFIRVQDRTGAPVPEEDLFAGLR